MGVLKNGILWKDVNGEPVHAHGGYIIYHEGYYYCLKGQTLIQNKPSVSECYFSASLEKALFSVVSLAYLYFWFRLVDSISQGMAEIFATGILLHRRMHTPYRGKRQKSITAKKYHFEIWKIRTF